MVQMKQKDVIIVRKLVKFAVFLLVILGVLLIYSSLEMFFAGTHNLDMSYNIANINGWFDTALMDVGSDGIIRTSEELHSLGLFQVKMALKILFSVMIFAIAFLVLDRTLRRKG